MWNIPIQTRRKDWKQIGERRIEGAKVVANGIDFKGTELKGRTQLKL